MLKRIIALTLMVALMIPCFSVSASAAGRNYKYENMCLKLITDLGIIDGTSNSTPDVYITRADSAKMFAKIFEIPGFEGKPIFNDVDIEMDCYNDVSLLCDMGIISKADKFRPSDLIEMNEFVTMAVNSVGLGIPAEQNGEWPAGHVNLALKEGLLRNVYWDSEGVMLSQAAIMIVNILKCEVNNYGEFGSYYTGGQSILEHLYKTYCKVGVITDNGITALTGETKLKKNQIAIDGMVFNTDQNIEKWLGYCVEVYYRYNKKSRINEIVSIAPATEKNYVTELKYDETTYNNGTYTYYEGGNKRTISIQPGTAIIYNGKALTSEQYADTTLYEMKPEYGTIKVLSNTGSTNGASVLFIDNYTNMLAKKYIADDEIITTYNYAGNIVLKDKEYRIFDKNGENIEVSAITNKKPMLVAASIDGEFVKIIADGSSVTGEISSISGSDSSIEYSIGEGVFKTAPALGKTLNLGAEGTFWLDALGNIFFFDAGVSSSNIFGYVIDYAVDDKSLNRDILVKVHTQFDMTQVVKIADIVKIDDIKYKKSTQEDLILSQLAACKEKIVMFSQNVKGDITVIDTANDDNHDGFRQVPGMDGTSSVQYYMETGLLGGRVVCDDNTIYFMVPNSGAEGEYVACGQAAFKKIDTRASGQREGIQAYVNGEDSVRVTALVQKTDYTGLRLAEARASFVEEIRKSMTDDGTLCYALTMTCRGVTATYKTEDEKVFDSVTRGAEKTPYTIGKGDIVCFGLNRNGEITYDENGDSSIRVLYSAKDRYFETDRNINSVYSSSYVVSDNFKRIYIYDSTDLEGYYKCTYKDPAVNTIESDDIYLYKLDSFATVHSYNRERDIIGTCTLNGLKTYKDNPSEYNECVFFAYDFDFASANYAFLAIYE